MTRVLQKLHVCPLGMCVVLVSNIGFKTTIFNTTQIPQQQIGKFMCVHWECAWCWSQILVLTPAYLTLHRYAHNTSETSCVSWECVWCYHQILVLEAPYPTLHKHAHNTSKTSCVSTGNVCGTSTKCLY